MKRITAALLTALALALVPVTVAVSGTSNSVSAGTHAAHVGSAAVPAATATSDTWGWG